MRDDATAGSGNVSAVPDEVPKLTGKLHDLIARASAQLPRIVDEVYTSVVRSDDAFTRMPLTTHHDIREHLNFTGELWFRTLLTGENFTLKDLATIADVGRRRVHQGIPLNSVLSGFRKGTLSVWMAILREAGNDGDVQDCLLFTVSPYLLQYFDRLAQDLSAAYLDEQYQRARWKEALRYELINFVFRFPDDETGFRKTCEALNLDATASYVAAVMDIDAPEVPPVRVEHELDQLLLAIAQSMKVDANALIRTLYRGRLIVWIPCVRGDSLLITDRLMRARAQALTKAIPEIHKIGMGLANSGASGWAISMEEGFKALDSRHASSEGDTCFMYSDVALYESVLRSGNALRYLDSIIERLALEPYLLQTLAAYFEHGQHQKRTSAALKVHPNTLNYRLSRVEEILGATLDDANWVARLAVAVRLRGL